MQPDYGPKEVGKLIDGLVGRIADAFDPGRPLNIIGIRTRGLTLAQRLVSQLGRRGFTHIGQGTLDITLYRDDLSEVGPKPMVRPTRIDIDLDGVPLLLVDDVLFTGRSIRAALDALVDFGRPAAIRLVTLVDRGGRELPIQPDFVALKLDGIPRNHRVNVHFQEVDGRDGIVIQSPTSAAAKQPTA